MTDTQTLEAGCPAVAGGQGTVHATAESIAPKNADTGVPICARQMPRNNHNGVMPLPRASTPFGQLRSTVEVEARFGRTMSIGEVLEALGL